MIIQKSHRYGYDHALRNCGIRFIEVETIAHYEQAFNERTVMAHFFNAGGSKISRIRRWDLTWTVPCVSAAYYFGKF